MENLRQRVNLASTQANPGRNPAMHAFKQDDTPTRARPWLLRRPGPAWPLGSLSTSTRAGAAPYGLPPLPYALDAPAPVLSADTLGYHHGAPQGLLRQPQPPDYRALSFAGLHPTRSVAHCRSARPGRGSGSTRPGVEPQFLLAEPAPAGGGKPPAELARRLEEAFRQRGALQEGAGRGGHSCPLAAAGLAGGRRRVPASSRPATPICC